MNNEVVSKEKRKMITVQKLIKHKLENECPNCGSSLFEVVKETAVKGTFANNKFSRPQITSVRVNCGSCYMNLIEIDEEGHIDLNPLV